MNLLRSFIYVFVAAMLFVAFVAGAFFQIFTQDMQNKKEQKPLEFTRNISATSKLIANTFVVAPSFDATETLAKKLELAPEDKVAIGELFKNILDRVGKDSFCSGGSYEVYPIYKYEQGARSIAGQALASQLHCKITKDQLSSYEAMMHDIDAIVNQSNYVRVSIPAIKPAFETADIKENEDKLYKQILLISKQYATEYSEELGLNCNVTALHFNAPMQMPQNFVAASVDSSNQSMAKSTIPIVTDKEFSSNATASFQCK